MRERRFDVAIDLQGLARSGVTAWLANAGLTIGLGGARNAAREGALAAYDRLATPPKGSAHAVDRYLSVLGLLNVPVHSRFQWLPERPVVGKNIRERAGTSGHRWVVLLPGARWDTKQWPVENFIALARHLLALSPDLKLAILGGPGDIDRGAKIASVDHARCVDLTGRTTLPEMVEWIRLSDLVITNDTGPMHVAAALGRPVVALFGPTDPRRTGPYGQLPSVMQATGLPCVPCFQGRCDYAIPLACLRAITPASVCEQARQRLFP
jgi:lipopolysaccharide heptosyltransferase II